MAAHVEPLIPPAPWGPEEPSKPGKALAPSQPQTSLSGNGIFGKGPGATKSFSQTVPTPPGTRPPTTSAAGKPS